MDENFMTQYGDRLMAGGFPFLPIMPGEKFPGRYERGKWMPYRGVDETRIPRHHHARIGHLEAVARRRNRYSLWYCCRRGYRYFR
ncbi:hypothetical protein SIID45300_02276 [Candidatus Magnetaquicoccaceae bacterium FCR-1]|uniref:Uncharacterized protein n=1 Tax=Candidatus Magnetaquiglobus chichijimensis TaxID=3141448 RepID=A0ABQ0CAN4_9PROT